MYRARFLACQIGGKLVAKPETGGRCSREELALECQDADERDRGEDETAPQNYVRTVETTFEP